jgi:hypothetical protein
VAGWWLLLGGPGVLALALGLPAAHLQLLILYAHKDTIHHGSPGAMMPPSGRGLVRRSSAASRLPPSTSTALLPVAAAARACWQSQSHWQLAVQRAGARPRAARGGRRAPGGRGRRGPGTQVGPLMQPRGSEFLFLASPAHVAYKQQRELQQPGARAVARSISGSLWHCQEKCPGGS